MTRKNKGRSKWMAALALCMVCFIACAALLTSSTMAADPDIYKAVDGHKNVYEVQNAGGSSKAPKQYVYSTSGTLGSAYALTLSEANGKYYAAVDAAGGKAYYLVEANGTLNTESALTEGPDAKFGTTDDVTKTGDAASTKKYKAIVEGKNLYEALTDAGAPKDPREFVYSSTSKPETCLPLAVTAYNSSYYIKFSGSAFVAVGADNTLDCGNAISAGTDGKISTGAVLFPVPAPSTPTPPAVAATDKFTAVSGFKYVYEVKTADGNSKNPKQFVYTTSATVNSAYAVPLYEKDGKYYIAANNVNTKHYYLVKADGALDTQSAYTAGDDGVFGNTDDRVLAGNTDGPQNYKAVGEGRNIYETLTTANASRSPQEFVYSSVNKPQNGLPLAVAAYNNLYYVLVAGVTGNVYIAAAADNTLDCNNVIQAGTDGKIASGTVLFPKVATPKYQLVTGYTKNLYEALDTAGNSKNPKEYVYCATEPTATGAKLAKVYVKDGKYYTEKTDYPTVYLLIKADGTLDETTAIWAGPDKTFGNADDKKAELRSGAYYYEVSAGEYELISVGTPTTAPTTTATTTSTSASSTTGGATTTTTNTFFATDGSKDSYPGTGKTPNVALMVVMAILLSACIYSGYRFFRREHSA